MKTQNVDPPLKILLNMLDQLTKEQEDHLRERLNTRYLQRQVRHVAKGDLARDASLVVGHFIDRLGSGNIDEDFHNVSAVFMKAAAKNVELVSEIFSGLDAPSTPPPKDPVTALEESYHEMQGDLIHVRQAVAQAIATEKQLEQQIQKNKDLVATWENRALMAVQQGNEDLAAQARQRQGQYSKSVTDLEVIYRDQREATGRLRVRLTDFECKVQKAYTRMQVAISRHRAEQATSVIDGFYKDTIDSMMETAEARLKEQAEAWTAAASGFTKQADAKSETSDEKPKVREASDTERLLIRTTAALEASNAMIERLERIILEREERDKSE